MIAVCRSASCSSALQGGCCAPPSLPLRAQPGGKLRLGPIGRHARRAAILRGRDLRRIDEHFLARVARPDYTGDLLQRPSQLHTRHRPDQSATEPCRDALRDLTAHRLAHSKSIQHSAVTRESDQILLDGGRTTGIDFDPFIAHSLLTQLASEQFPGIVIPHHTNCDYPTLESDEIQTNVRRPTRAMLFAGEHAGSVPARSPKASPHRRTRAHRALSRRRRCRERFPVFKVGKKCIHARGPSPQALRRHPARPSRPLRPLHQTTSPASHARPPDKATHPGCTCFKFLAQSFPVTTIASAPVRFASPTNFSSVRGTNGS